MEFYNYGYAALYDRTKGAVLGALLFVGLSAAAIHWFTPYGEFMRTGQASIQSVNGISMHSVPFEAEIYSAFNFGFRNRLDEPLSIETVVDAGPVGKFESRFTVRPGQLHLASIRWPFHADMLRVRATGVHSGREVMGHNLTWGEYYRTHGRSSERTPYVFDIR